MKYSSLILASALAFSVSAQAAESDAASGTKVAANQTQFSEYRAECIELGISDELTGDQLKSYVDKCISEKSAGRAPASGGGGD
jgi:hypothetical protein